LSVFDLCKKSPNRKKQDPNNKNPLSAEQAGKFENPIPMEDSFGFRAWAFGFIWFLDLGSWNLN
jgi:hypothetical protein